MAALSTQSAQLVRQKVNGITRHPAIFYALKGLFRHLSSYEGNPDLQFLAYDGVADFSTTGVLLVGSACTVYAVYGKKANTATDQHLNLFDDTSSDDTAGDVKASLAFPLAGIVSTGTSTPGDVQGEALAIWPEGIPFAAGIWINSSTTAGSTQGTASDAPRGFVIAGA